MGIIYFLFNIAVKNSVVGHVWNEVVVGGY
jgi:hypothetical protein